MTNKIYTKNDNLYIVDNDSEDWTFKYVLNKKKFIKKYDNDYYDFIVQKIQNLFAIDNNNTFEYLQNASYKSCILMKPKRKIQFDIKILYITVYNKYKLDSLYKIDLNDFIDKPLLHKKIIDYYHIYQFPLGDITKLIKVIQWFGWFVKNKHVQDINKSLIDNSNHIVDISLICKEDKYEEQMMQIKNFEKEPDVNYFL